MFLLDSLKGSGFSWQTALSLAVASQRSYDKKDVVIDIAKSRWGFTSVKFLNRRDTQGFIAETSDIQLIAFRGTESFRDWLGNIQVTKIQRPYGSIHKGFFNGFDAVRDEVSHAIANAQTNGKKIWICGHSLGGTLAAIAAVEIAIPAMVSGIYTYGQPRSWDGQSKGFFTEKFPGRYFRFVNDEDIVTKIPPGFEHAGSLIHFDASGNIEERQLESDGLLIEPQALSESEFRQLQEEIKAISNSLPEAELETNSDVLDATVEGIIPGSTDHRIVRYISAINKQASPSESAFDPVLTIEFENLQASNRLRASKSNEFGAQLESTDGGVAEISAMADADDELFPALVQLRTDTWRAPQNIIVQSQFGNYATIEATRQDLKSLSRDPDILSIEASREAGIEELADSLPFVGIDKIHRPPLDERGANAIIGIIDSGVDVLHEAFRDANGQTRILAIWDQRDRTGEREGHTPRDVDPDNFTQAKGSLYLQSDIQGFINDGSTPVRRLRDPSRHGTHVASIAAGRGVGSIADGVAPDAGIIVVVPDMEGSDEDPRSLGYSVSHVAALHFLKKVAAGRNRVLAEARPMAINVSLGMNAGAHDGSSVLENAFDGITGHGRDPGFVIVKSAGNERNHDGHTHVRAFQGLRTVVWNSSADTRTKDYIEAWYDALDDLEFTLVDPTGNRLGPVLISNPEMRADLDGNDCHLSLTPLHRDNGDSRLVITIIPLAAPIHAGQWSLEILGTAVRSRDPMVHLWVERTRGRDIEFSDSDEEMTLSIPGTANTIITVGACHSADPLELTVSSSFGRTRDGRPKPDICAPGARIIAAHAMQDDHQDAIDMTGTSMAAPHVTGALALVMSHRHGAGLPQYNARQLQAALVRTAKKLNGAHHEGFGFGMLDGQALFEMLK